MTYIVVGIFILFDICTGILKAVYQGNINSTALRQGLYHKLSEVIAVAGSGLLEIGMNYINIGINLPVLNVVAGYLCITEFVSVLENICAINSKLAKLFNPYLEKLKVKEGTENDNVNEGEKRD